MESLRQSIFKYLLFIKNKYRAWSGKMDLVVKQLAKLIKTTIHILFDKAHFGIRSKIWKDIKNASNFIHFLFVLKTQGRPKVGEPISWGMSTWPRILLKSQERTHFEFFFSLKYSLSRKKANSVKRRKSFRDIASTA